ncbi:MAG: LysR substrate-binding domain-containing protein [Gammaproteobacteria bacterium]
MKISRKHLSLRGLRTFAYAARHLSFRAAAEELFVTASAVSHQIKHLEQELDVALFERGNRALRLTEAGAALYADVGGLIDELDRVTAPYRDRAARRVLRLSVQPFFASELLVPRLASFADENPLIDIHLDTTDEQPHHHSSTSDVSLRIFHHAPPGLAADAFYPLRLLPGCAPSLHAQIVKKGDALTQPFPMIVHSGRRGDWKHWAKEAGVPLPKASRIIELNSMVAVVDAAEQGVGVALIPMPLSTARFESGRLQSLHPFEAAMPDRYYFVSTESASRTKPVQAFRRWVLQTFADTV